MITVKAIDFRDKKEKEIFIRFPWKIYTDNSYWVPPLLLDMRSILNVDKHPFYEFGSIQGFMAFKNGEAVGRIAAIDNPRFNNYQKKTIGFWGFFECINDQGVANALFDSVCEWAKLNDYPIMHGPASPSNNYDYGLLVEGFNESPRIFMSYNPIYYFDLVEAYGFRKVMGLSAYKLNKENTLKNPILIRAKNFIKTQEKVEIRYFNKKNFKQDILLFKELYYNVFKSNTDFVPMTDKELDLMAGNLKILAIEKLLPFLVSETGELIGFAMAVPDYNQILKSFKGKLFPFNFLKLFSERKKIKWIRVILLGILPKFHNQGYGAILYEDIFKNASGLGFEFCECSWILEDNKRMNKNLELMNGELYKRYNVYEINVNSKSA